MTLKLPDISPAASFDHLSQVSSTFQSLQDDVAAYSDQFGSDYSVSGRNAINPQPIEPLSSSLGNDNACSTVDIESETSAEEVYSGGEREMLFSFEADQAFAYDTETGVYMKNVQTGSWAGRMCDDETKDVEIQNMVALNHVRRAQQSAAAQQMAAEQQTAQSYYTTNAPAHNVDSTKRSYSSDGQIKKHDRASEMDNAARVVISAIKSALTEGGTLILEHTGAREAYRHSCSACTTYMHAKTYYVCVEVQMLEDYQYCLTCFEGMWNGEMIIGKLPDPDPRVFKKNLDGKRAEADQCACHSGMEDMSYLGESRATTGMYAVGGGLFAEDQDYFVSISHNAAQQQANGQGDTIMSGALLDSKHAPGPNEIAASQLANSIGFATQHYNKEPQPTLSALRSTLQPQSSNAVRGGHCGRFLPSRFQHLAQHIEAGVSLNEIEQAALSVWKATTKEQFRCMSNFLATSMDTKMEIEARGKGSNLEDAVKMVGLGKLKFYGKDLSEVLATVVARDDV